MTYYDKNERFIIGVDYDGTITSFPLGSNDFPPPQKGFIEFYKKIQKYNKTHKDDPIFLVLHTARNLDDDNTYNYLVEYFNKYNLSDVFIPKRDGITIKSIKGERDNFPVKFSYNSKLPCSCFIDDINICTPKLSNGQLNWKKITRCVFKELKKIHKYWEIKDIDDSVKQIINSKID